MLAAKAVADKVLQLDAHLLEADPADLALIDGSVVARDALCDDLRGGLDDPVRRGTQLATLNLSS